MGNSKSGRVALLLWLLLAAGALLSSQATPLKGELRCQCIERIATYISGKRIARIDIIPEGPHCAVPEVIITLKNGRETCLDPQAPWVERIITKLMKK